MHWLRTHIVVIYATFALLYLFLPIAFVAAFSFNDPLGRYNFTWQGFTTRNWTHICAVPGMCNALGLSLRIGILSTAAATVLGTLIAFAVVRHRFRGRAGTNMLIFLPMATPEVVMGSSLLALFVNLNVSLGFATVLVAHILFNISFVVVTVKVRLQGLDPRLEQAAMDLYANEWETFRRVTFPLVFPGIMAAALLAFSLSFDDFIITNFNAGNTTVTFPMFVWGAAQRGIPPQINVIGTLMFVSALVITLIGTLAGRRPRR
ncbi:MAG: ABC transporter permease [Actinomycetota bacterium]|nr:ABC transporter permease [Actinomycetota bacterium]